MNQNDRGLAVGEPAEATTKARLATADHRESRCSPTKTLLLPESHFHVQAIDQPLEAIRIELLEKTQTPGF